MSVLNTLGSRLTRRLGDVQIALPEKAKRGEIIEVRALILHPSQSGDNALFIEEVTFALDGETFCRFDLSSMSSANPYLAVPLRVEKSGMISAHWRNNRGQTGSGQKFLRLTE
ncbi:thiosulfate oxidation carrier complex protein SoxZ [Acidithiobacillus sp. AMEEHan]|uniref:thiosulfate oxidation carrier complex protein SoxZ n=1 Tax=Acidithiobacillus sp. AMEEHan TaxID=2994951 RepID=UPI0027E559D6|nr:thiosulfate oxidation carrier complex protein SoxZ [Acidithiobacillus sp. AMEEHan]